MLTPGRLYVGTSLRLRIAFRDENGVLIDPDTVTFETYSPCGSRRTYVYETDAEVTQIATGRYAADIVPEEPGRWRFRWLSTGEGEAIAEEGDFLIQDSPFADATWPCCDYVP